MQQLPIIGALAPSIVSTHPCSLVIAPNSGILFTTSELRSMRKMSETCLQNTHAHLCLNILHMEMIFLGYNKYDNAAMLHYSTSSSYQVAVEKLMFRTRFSSSFFLGGGILKSFCEFLIRKSTDNYDNGKFDSVQRTNRKNGSFGEKI